MVLKKYSLKGYRVHSHIYLSISDISKWLLDTYALFHISVTLLHKAGTSIKSTGNSQKSQRMLAKICTLMGCLNWPAREAPTQPYFQGVTTDPTAATRSTTDLQIYTHFPVWLASQLPSIPITQVKSFQPLNTNWPCLSLSSNQALFLNSCSKSHTLHTQRL